MKVKIFRKPNKLQNEDWEINKYRMIVCIFVMVKKCLWYLSIKLCVFYPWGFGKGYEHTKWGYWGLFNTHYLAWLEGSNPGFVYTHYLAEITEVLYKHYLAGLEGSNLGLSCRLPLPPLTCSGCCMSGRHWCGPLCHHAAHCKVIHEENIYHSIYFSL